MAQGKRVLRSASGRRRAVRGTLIGILALVALVSAGKLLSYGLENSRAQRRFRDLSVQVHAAGARPGGGRRELPAAGEGEDPKAALAALREQNPDLAGWVTVEGTGIDYPVMHTPQDPQYYLRRDFDGAYSASGTPFLDGRCTLESDNLILWGHNMRSGTMFAGLLEYQRPEYAGDHSAVRFSTPEETRTYEVIAAFRSEVDRDGDYFRWYDCLDFGDRADFDAFAAGLRASSLLPVPEDLAWGDAFLTLATCSYHDQNGRFVVVARAVAEEEVSFDENIFKM